MFSVNLKRATKIGIIVAIILATELLWPKIASRVRNPGWPDNIDLAGVSTRCCISFPPSTRLVHGNWWSCKCDLNFVHAKLTMDRKDVDVFVRGIRGKAKEVSGATPTPANAPSWVLKMSGDEEKASGGITDSRTEKLGIVAENMEGTGHDPTWWEPDLAIDFLAIRVAEYPGLTEPEKLRIVVDYEDPKVAVVYLDYGEHP